jgi:hypothetical protein
MILLYALLAVWALQVLLFAYLWLTLPHPSPPAEE